MTTKTERDRDFRLKRDELDLKKRELDLREEELGLRSSELNLGRMRLYGDWFKTFFRYVVLYGGSIAGFLYVIVKKSIVADLLPEYFREMAATALWPTPWTVFTIALLMIYSVIATVGWRVQLFRARRGIKVKSRLQGKLEENDDYRSTSGLRENGSSPK